jgi:exodeoxyribonuclease-3
VARADITKTYHALAEILMPTVATWNVNSIRARRERVLGWLDRTQPDIVCLQETKVVDGDFPADVLESAGYRVVFHGQKTYNGVAILSKESADSVVRGFEDGGDDSQARFLSADVAGIRVLSAYVPNGQKPDTDPYFYKLEWLARLRAFLERSCDPSKPLVLCGDFNVAPEDRDVHDPQAWKNEILCTDREREALKTVLDFGLEDTFRLHHSDEGLFSWWDYRMLGFPKNKGLRIDFVFASRPLAERCSKAWIDRDERKGKGASDHAPVLAEFSD